MRGRVAPAPDSETFAWSLLTAVAVHGALLFGVRLDLGAAPMPQPEPMLEVALLGPSQDAATSRSVAPPGVPAPAPLPAAAEARPAPRAAVVRRRPTLPSAAPARAASPPPPAPAETTRSEPAPPGPAGIPSGVAPKGATTGGATAAALQPGLVTARPRYKSNPEPPYPLDARRRRQQGSVLLAVRVSAAGKPESVAVARSSGFAALDAAAVGAVREWEFEPGRLDGAPVSTEVEVPIRFELR